jgi:hypothetical protein
VQWFNAPIAFMLKTWPREENDGLFEGVQRLKNRPQPDVTAGASRFVLVADITLGALLKFIRFPKGVSLQSGLSHGAVGSLDVSA